MIVFSFSTLKKSLNTISGKQLESFRVWHELTKFSFRGINNSKTDPSYKTKYLKSFENGSFASFNF